MDIPLPPSPPGPPGPTVDEYSPSHVTSDHSDDEDKFEKFIEQKSSTTSEHGSNFPKPKLLGTSRATKLLHSFKTAKSGPITMDLGRTTRPKISKLKNFDDEEAEHQVNWFGGEVDFASVRTCCSKYFHILRHEIMVISASIHVNK